MPPSQEKQIMAELTHEQLWHVCQRKPGDYEPYGKRNRLMAGRTCLAGLGRLRQFGESPCRAAHL